MASERALLEGWMTRVDQWIGDLSREGRCGDLDAAVLKGVLESFGARYEGLYAAAESALRGYSNRESEPGMRAVWGEGRRVAYSRWCEEWADRFEAQAGNRGLPRLERTGIRTAGMRQFFHEITALAGGYMTAADFKLFIETRLGNGKLWQEGRKDERIKVVTPTSGGEPIRIGSIPPGFIEDAWEWLKASVPDSNVE